MNIRVREHGEWQEWHLFGLSTRSGVASSNSANSAKTVASSQVVMMAQKSIGTGTMSDADSWPSIQSLDLHETNGSQTRDRETCWWNVGNENKPYLQGTRDRAT